MTLSVLVTGVTGYVGSQLVPRLLDDGHRVRGFARSGGGPPGIDVVRGDVSTGAGLDAAMAGIDVACYLIHSMEGGDGDFSAQELEGARRFAAAGRAAGVRRVVFLGGLTPDDDDASEHLASRGAVEGVLLDAFREGVAFRASMVIGCGSRSFDLLSELVRQLPVLALPAWRDRRTRPIDHRDLVDYLAGAVASDAVGHAEVFEIGGDGAPTTYGDIVTRIADLAVDGRPSVDLPFDATPLASRLTAAVTGEDVGLVRPLMESLQHDLVPDDARARRFFSVTPRCLDDSLRDAVAGISSAYRKPHTR